MFSDPTKIVEQAGVLPGLDIADLGVGSGAYATAAAKALLSTGRVYAVDVQKDLLTKLKNQAARDGLYNIEVIWGNIEKPNGTGLRDNSIDLVMLCNTLFQLEERGTIVKEIKRILKPAGKVLFVEWSEAAKVGPKKEMVVKKEKARDMFEKNGFHVDREINSGDHHYGFLFKKL